MKKIGKGLQYKVYDIGNGRVRKTLQSPRESKLLIMSWLRPKAERQALLAQDYQALSRQSLEHIQAILAEHPELGDAFGHPEFEADGAYSQDKVQTLGDALRAASREHAQKLIDSYIDLNLRFWRYGLSDWVYNFTINNGVDANGNVILIDLGEIESDLDRAIGYVTQQHWLQQWSYTADLPKTLQPYFKEQMASRLTAEVLIDTWCTAAPSN